MMSAITKYLGALAGLLILIEVMGPSVYGLFFQQCESNRRTLKEISQQLRTKELALRQAEATTNRYEQRAKLNFESDQAKAQVMYQEYLVRLTDACTLNSVMINCSQPERVEELGYVLHFSLQTTGTTDQFGRLIDGFYKTDALHRLTHLSVFQSLGPDAPIHSLTMEIALLVLSDVPSSTSKLAPPTNALQDSFASVDIFRRRLAEPSAPSLASGMEMLSSIFSNISAQPPELSSAPTAIPIVQEPAPVEPVQEPPVAAPIDDPKSNLRLVGIIQKGSVKHAIFFDMVNNLQHAFTEHSSLEAMKINAEITQIQEADVRLVENNQQLQLSLGELYTEAVKR